MQAIIMDDTKLIGSDEATNDMVEAMGLSRQFPINERPAVMSAYQ